MQFAVPPSECRPPTQLSQTTAPVSDRLPASQSVHLDAREPEKRPAPQSLHVAWPVRLRLYLPLAHSEHETVARAAAYVPFSHVEHDGAPVPL